MPEIGHMGAGGLVTTSTRGTGARTAIGVGRWPSVPTPTRNAVERRRHDARRWRRTYACALAAADAAMVQVAAFLGLVVRFHLRVSAVDGVPYWVVALLLSPTWLLFLAAGRAYERRFIAEGSEELRRGFDASVRYIAVVGLLAFLGRLPLSRIFIGLTLVIGTGLILADRLVARFVVRRLRRTGRTVSRVVVLGDRRQVEDVVAVLGQEKRPGFVVVGACTPGGSLPGDPPLSVPALGSLTTVMEAVRRADADTIAVTNSRGINARTLRRLAWELEGTEISLVVAPQLVDVAGPRISIRPIAGLPLLHVEQPEFTGARRVLKRVQDTALALVALLVLAPLLAVVALAVWLSSPGPALFRQVRIGRGGEEFTVWKFRTMYLDAEQRLEALRASNEGSGLLFKMRNDPRVTPLGKWLRRLSLDELPQLINVVNGDMALVGPRPPLPAEVQQYGYDVARRLLVTPGITGLWQVSGRSDLAWDDAVRLDLFYVENWSLALDLQIIWRTIGAVLRSQGAY